MIRLLLVIVLCGCGASSTHSVEPSGTQQPSEPQAAAEPTSQGSGSEARTPVSPERISPERVNLSAGPPRPGAAVVPQHGNRDEIEALALLPGHARAAVGTMTGGLVTLVDIPSGRVRASRRCFRGSILKIQPSADGTRLLITGTPSYGHDEPRLGVWDLRDDTFERIDTSDGDYGVSSAVISPDGARVAYLMDIVGRDDEHKVLDVVSLGQPERHRRRIDGGRKLHFSRDGSRLLLVGDGAVEFLDGASGARRHRVALSGADHATLHPRRDIVAVAGATSLKLFDFRGRVQAQFATRARQLAFDGSGDRLAYCTRDDKLLIRSGTEYAEESDPVVGCGSTAWLHFRGEPLVVEERGSSFEVRRPGAPGLDVRHDGHSLTLAFSERRRDWFLVGGFQDVHIYNLRLERLRRIVRGGAGERSAWRVERRGDVLRLVGKAWHADFGGQAEGERAERSFPRVRGEHFVLSESPDGAARIIVRDPVGDMDLLLAVADAPRAVDLRPPRDGFGVYCGEEGDGQELSCSGRVEWGPDNRFVVSGEEALASYAPDGRRLAVAADGLDVRYAADDTLLLRRRDGSMSLTNARLRTKARIFNAHRGVQAEASFGSGLLAATRGRVLQIFDLASAERRHRIELSERAVAPPVVRPTETQLQSRRGFVWYANDDARETRRVDVEDIRALDEAVSEAVYCADGRLRFRVLSETSSTDLAPCPQRSVTGFDDELVWWTDGNAGKVLRRSDGQLLILRALHMRRDVMQIAHTPEGQIQVSRTNAMGEILVRGPGAVLDAPLERIDEETLSTTLVADFIAGRPVSPASN